jgi:hypothetical protein
MKERSIRYKASWTALKATANNVCVYMYIMMNNLLYDEEQLIMNVLSASSSE